MYLQVIRDLVQLYDIKDMPNYNPTILDGCDSVSTGRVYWTDNNLVTCATHGAMLAVNPDRTIWRCPACHEGAYVKWDSDFKQKQLGQ